MSLRCLIIDDEPLAHEVILNYSEDIPFLTIQAQCYRATEAFEVLNNMEIDLIFLDIRMPKLNGLEFLKTLHLQPMVIITSAFEEYAIESFDLAVCDYLLKPFRFDRFLKAVNRALANHDLRLQQQQTFNNMLNAYQETQISIKCDKKHIMVQIKEICYLESLGNYVKVWRNGDFLLTARTLSSFEAQLSAHTFARIHKSYLLNKKFVHYLEGNTIHLKNGAQLPIGKNHKKDIKQLLDIDSLA